MFRSGDGTGSSAAVGRLADGDGAWPELAGWSEQIDDTTWTRIARDADMRASRAGHPRRYLRELLTRCSLRTAPPPITQDAEDVLGSAWAAP
jgi:hypothetical protein